MSENEEMNDQEFEDFVLKNKARIKTILKASKDGSEDFFKKEAKKAKKKAKKAKKKLEAKASEADDRFKDLRDAVFSPEVQKHIVGAGVEIALGISAFISAIPKSEKTQDFFDKAEEMRHNASAVVCAKNPDCIRKKASERKEEIRKIEID